MARPPEQPRAVAARAHALQPGGGNRPDRAAATVLAGGATTLVGLVSLGAFLKMEKSTCYTAEQNPVPFLSMFARTWCCAKKSEDHDAKAECSNGMHTSYLVDKGSKTLHDVDV